LPVSFDRSLKGVASAAPFFCYSSTPNRRYPAWKGTIGEQRMPSVRRGARLGSRLRYRACSVGVARAGPRRLGACVRARKKASPPERAGPFRIGALNMMRVFWTSRYTTSIYRGTPPLRKTRGVTRQISLLARELPVHIKGVGLVTLGYNWLHQGITLEAGI